MKIKKVLACALALSLLTSCGGEKTNSTEEKPVQASTEEVKEEKQEVKEEIQEASADDQSDLVKPGETRENEDMSIKAIKAGIVDNEITVGPIKINIDGVLIGEMVPKSPELKTYYDDQEKIPSIFIYANVENQEDSNVNFYFTQAKLTTDTQEQIDPDFLVSEGSGEFLGKVKKDMSLVYYPKSNLEDINEITIHIDGPSGEDYSRIGEDVKIKIKFDDKGQVSSIEQVS